MATTEIVVPLHVTDANGALANADSLPTGKVMVNGYPVTDTPYVSPTADTGVYTATLVIDVADFDDVALHFTAQTGAGAANWSALFIANIDPLTPTRVSQLDKDLAAEGDAMALTPAERAAVRDELLNRILAGNHDVAGSVGKALQDAIKVALGHDADGTLTEAVLTEIAERTSAEVNATGTGATLVEVTVLDDSAVAVSAANVNIYASDGSPLGIYALTDVAGKVQFQLNDGDYLAGISAQSAFEPHTPQAFTVAAGNIVDGKIPVALTFTRTASVPPVDPALCRVKFYVMDASSTAAVGVSISATPLNRAMTVPTKVLTLIAATATTDATGYAELLLPRADAINSLGSKAYRITLRKDGAGIYDVVEKEIPNTGETTFDVVVNG